MTFSPDTLLPPPVQPGPEYSNVVANPEILSYPSSSTDTITSLRSSPTPNHSSISFAQVTADSPPDVPSQNNNHEESTDSDGTVADNNPLQLNTEEFPAVQEASEKTSAQDPASENAHASSSHLPFTGIVSRVAAIPTISETVSFVNDSVTSVFRKHRIARLALNTTLRTVTLGASFAEKIASPVKPVLDKMDNGAVMVLDRVEKKFPIINRRPRDIVNTVSDMVTEKSDTAAHKVLEIRPIRSCVQLSATTLRTINDGVDKVLHKANIEGPNQHSTIYNGVESLTRHVLGLVNETCDGDWRSKVEARRQSRCESHANTVEPPTSSSYLIASYHGSEIIAA